MFNDGVLSLKAIIIGSVAFVLVLAGIIGGLFWLNDDGKGDVDDLYSKMSVYGQEKEPYRMDDKDKVVHVNEHHHVNYYNSYDDYNYDYSSDSDYNYDYSSENYDYDYDYSSEYNNDYNYESGEVIEGLENLPEFCFSSGAGAWRTMMTLNPDGTFAGKYSDSDMGDTGEGYPRGVCYVSTFSGKFTDIKKVDEYTYSMKLVSVETEENVGDEWIENGIKYIASNPYGLEDGEEFLLYLPGAVTDTLPEGFISWMQILDPCGELEETLTTYGLYNVDMAYGFMGEGR